MRKLLILLFLLASFFVRAQQDLYIGGQMDAGILHSSAIEGNELNQKLFSTHLGASLSVSLRMFDCITVEAGLGQHRNNYRLKDEAFEKVNEGFSVKLNNSNYYWSYYFSMSGAIRLNSSSTYLYGKLTYSVNTFSRQEISKSKSFQIARTNTDQTIDFTNVYRESNNSIQPEIGIQFKTADRNLLSLGLKMNLSQSDMFNGTYSITNNTDGSSVSRNISSIGNFAALVFRYDFLLTHISKKERSRGLSRKDIKAIELKDLKKPSSDNTTDTLKNDIDTSGSSTPIDTNSVPILNKDTNTIDSAITIPKEIDGRTLNISKKVKVHSSKVKVFIWDHQTVDGDRVSLHFNGQWILVNYTLKKAKYEFELNLIDGMNIFVLHALNLGKYSPNTAALIVEEEDGKQHKIILESDLKESGTLEIDYKKRRKQK